MRTVVVALLLMLLTGCAAPDEIDLDSRWSPLAKLKANASVPSGVYRTFAAVCESHDLSGFVALSTDAQDALLAHESLHAARQAAYPGGPSAYIARYDSDPDFMAAEEELGWSAQIRYAVTHGVEVDVSYVASFMAATYVQGPTSPNPGRAVFDINIVTAWVTAQVQAAGGQRG